MTQMRLSRALLALIVAALGFEIGAGLYEALVLVPLWSGEPPDSIVTYNLQALRPEPGLHFWIVSTPLVGALALANLIASWRSRSPHRAWWLMGSGAALAVVVVTFLYFVPEISAFSAVATVATPDLATRVSRWVFLNWVRAAIYLGAWVSLAYVFGQGAEQAGTRNMPPT
jgi:hypothetical protein